MLVEEIGVFGSIGTNLCGSVLIGACGLMLVNVRERGRGDFNQEGERERQVSSMEAAVSLRMERKREFSDGF